MKKGILSALVLTLALVPTVVGVNAHYDSTLNKSGVKTVLKETKLTVDQAKKEMESAKAALDAKRKEAEKILNALDKEFGGEFKTNDLAAANLYAIINGVGKDSSVTRCSATLKNVERKIRNIAAHQVVAIDEKDIKSECQISSKEIVRMMHLMAQKSKIATSDDWKSYDKMNEYIKEMI